MNWQFPAVAAEDDKSSGGKIAAAVLEVFRSSGNSRFAIRRSFNV